MVGMDGRAAVSLEERLERAIADYLAVSRADGLFAHEAARDQAEEEAWERLQAARAELDAARGGAHGEPVAATGD